tara:strand:- start:1629 stop:2165 length:537 start_codon:yes stop_codon:yes gene_type:complete
MPQITENLVWSSDVSNTGVTNPENSTSSDDSKTQMANDSSTDWIFELTNLSQTPSSIVSVIPKFESNSGAAFGAIIWAHRILNGSNTTLYSENVNTPGDDDSVTTLTTRTTSDGSTAWTENDINTLRIQFDRLATAGGGTHALLDHYYVEVVYNVEAGIVNVSSGTINLTSGILKLSV